MKLKIFSTILLLLLQQTINIDCHGKLMDPPARSSAWREDPERFPAYYNDNQMFCGGFDTQWRVNKGRCGICGEEYSAEKLFEKGGEYYRGYTVRTYTQGQTIKATVDINANHFGYFEFRVCNTDELNGGEATQACLNQNLLRDKFGRNRFQVKPKLIGPMVTELVLPKGLSCEHCVFQWRYHAGNSWNTDPVTKKSCLGCGPQEEFYGCSDIKIVGSLSKNSNKIEHKENTRSDEAQDDDNLSTNIPNSLLNKLVSELKRLKEIEQKYKSLTENGKNLEEKSLVDDHLIYSNQPILNYPVRETESINGNGNTIVYPNQPIPSQEFNKEKLKSYKKSTDQTDGETIVYPNQPVPSQEFGVKANKRKYDLNFYETREEPVNNEVNNNGNLEGVQDGEVILFPNKARPTEFYKKNYLNNFLYNRELDNYYTREDVNTNDGDVIVYPNQPRPSQVFGQKNRKDLDYLFS